MTLWFTDRIPVMKYISHRFIMPKGPTLHSYGRQRTETFGRLYCRGSNCPDYADENFWWDGKDMKDTSVSAGVYFRVVKTTLDSKLTPVFLQGSVIVFR